jgi:hypothetical protein
MTRRFKRSAGRHGVFGNVRTSMTTTTRYTGTISVKDLRKKFKIPEDATITVHVPGGGDWSDMNLDLEEIPIQVSWVEVV